MPQLIYLIAPGFYKDPEKLKLAVDLSRITPQEAIQHPRWSMGAKISVDSATLMNKGLEVIEAMWLFELELEQIKILIHPQSLVHSLVEFKDGTIFAHLAGQI